MCILNITDSNESIQESLDPNFICKSGLSVRETLLTEVVEDKIDQLNLNYQNKLRSIVGSSREETDSRERLNSRIEATHVLSRLLLDLENFANGLRTFISKNPHDSRIADLKTTEGYLYPMFELLRGLFDPKNKQFTLYREKSFDGENDPLVFKGNMIYKEKKLYFSIFIKRKFTEYNGETSAPKVQITFTEIVENDPNSREKVYKNIGFRVDAPFNPKKASHEVKVDYIFPNAESISESEVYTDVYEYTNREHTYHSLLTFVGQKNEFIKKPLEAFYSLADIINQLAEESTK